MDGMDIIFILTLTFFIIKILIKNLSGRKIFNLSKKF